MVIFINVFYAGEYLDALRFFQSLCVRKKLQPTGTVDTKVMQENKDMRLDKYLKYPD